MFRHLSVALALLAAPLLAQTRASYEFFGAASGAPWGQHLVVSGPPRVGTSFTVSVAYTKPPHHMPRPYRAWLVTGLSRRSTPVPGLGLTLLTSPDVVMAASLRGMRGTPPAVPFTISIPNDRYLVGLRVYQQIIVRKTCGIPPQHYTYIYVATNGGEAVVGS